MANQNHSNNKCTEYGTHLSEEGARARYADLRNAQGGGRGSRRSRQGQKEMARPPMPLGAVVKGEEMARPPVPLGDFFKEENVPPMPLDAVY